MTHHRSTIGLVAVAGLAACVSAQTDIFWDAGDGVWSDSANWDPMISPSLLTHNAFINSAGVTVSLDATRTINDLTIGSPTATLVIDPVRTLGLAGNMHNLGLILVNPTTSANNGVIRFDGVDAQLTGFGGVLRLSGGAAGLDAVLNTGAGGMLTNNADHTIDGSGVINALLVNNGLVLASDSGFESHMVLQGDDKVNNADIEADTDATLTISSITLSQGPMGRVHARDGGVVELSGTNTIIGGEFGSTNTGVFRRLSSGTTTLDGVALDATLDVLPIGTVSVMGPDFVHTGLIILNDSTSANNAVLLFGSDCTMTGGGTVFLGGGGDDSQVNTAADVTVTAGAGITIEGSGQINAALVNNGLVRAIPTTNGGATLTLRSEAKGNNGQMVAEAGAELELSGIALSQGATGELLADGGTVLLTGTNSITGGTIRSINGGIVQRAVTGTTTLDGAIIEGTLDVAFLSTVVGLGPVLDNRGLIILNDSTNSNNAVLQFGSDCTMTGGGTVFLGGGFDDSQVNTDVGVTVTNDVANTIEGSGQINGALVNNGLVRAIPTDNGGAVLTLMANAKENHGQLVAEAGAELELSGTSLSQGATGELLADGGTVVLTGTNSITGGTIRSINGGIVQRAVTGTTTLDGAIIEGTLDVAPFSTVVVAGSVLDNRGLIILNDSTSSNDAVLQFGSDCTLTGGGTVFLGGGGNDSQVNTTAPAVLTVDDTSTIEGEGQLNGVFSIEGTIKPGLPVGPLTGSMDLTFEASATYHVEASSASNADRINTTGTIQNGGTIQVVARDGYTPQLNDQFNIITAAQVTGLFDDITFSGAIIAPDIALRAVYTPTSVDIRFVCIADLAPPYGVLDLADIAGFTSAFLAQDPLADLAEPFGVFDLADIGAFIQAFLSGCQ